MDKSGYTYHRQPYKKTCAGFTVKPKVTSAPHKHGDNGHIQNSAWKRKYRKKKKSRTHRAAFFFQILPLCATVIGQVLASRATNKRVCAQKVWQLVRKDTSVGQRGGRGGCTNWLPGGTFCIAIIAPDRTFIVFLKFFVWGKKVFPLIGAWHWRFVNGCRDGFCNRFLECIYLFFLKADEFIISTRKRY